MYFRCDCGEVFTDQEADIHSVNITDNYWENYYICPNCGNEAIEEITKEEYEELTE